MGERFDIVRSALEDGGPFEFIWTVNPKCGPPVHSHVETETLEVLEGTLDFRIGNLNRVLAAGEKATLPKGARHRLRGAGKVPCRVRVVYDGPLMERTFAELAPGDLKGFVRMVRHCVVEDFAAVKLANPGMRIFFRVVSALGAVLGIKPLHAIPRAGK